MTMASKPLLLAIDDEESIRGSLSAFFEDCGFSVLEASDGCQGLQMVREQRPDLVITDLRMPHLDGLEVIDAVRRLDDNLPVIVLSGTGVLTDAIQALRRGAWDYLAKPIHDMVELELIVKRCLEQARLVRDNRTCRDNLEQLVAERTAELRKLFTAVEQSANSVVITDADGVIEYVNPKFAETSGYSFAEAKGRNPRILNTGMHPPSYYRELWGTLLAGHEWRGEFFNRRKNGEHYWERCGIAPIRDETGTITHFVAIKEDITERKEYEEKLFQQATHDSLTGLPNRYHLQSHLELLVNSIDREKDRLSLVLLDIDNLKFINDTFGHEFGDNLLREVARRLLKACGDHCFVARFMGDEFVVVPPLTSGKGSAQEQVERARKAMDRVFVINGKEVTTTISIGIASYPEDGECVASLLKNAESAMFQAKKGGKNSVVCYTRELNHRLMERFDLENRLHRALENDEFSLHYQPQISLPTGRIVGMEALLRWTPEGRGPVSPAVFIPLLEESGLIVAVGEWVLWQACRQCVQWQRAGLPLRLSVNISALQFIRSDLGRTIRKVLAETGLDPRLLCLELTESMVMIDNDQAIATMESLTATGAVLSLDDFGTGYSSLAYLGRLPINELKIDQSFIKKMLTSRTAATVVNTIIAMGQELDMELVAEGVETDEQLTYLLDRNCTVMQGYLFSRPLSAEQCASFVQEWELPAPLTGIAPGRFNYPVERTVPRYAV
ncbi:EAL domain-containing protein [Geobacter sp. SVR]|uniref:EAL domain-containing response regulator n=1 Tax=Geobacter sp. SVR TaxID=2495594 RepID=UPI00143EFFBE|nr:EAL domain-containing protein [Geobacter sp. SVR]BCS55681.1 two-component system response regulator [Geobacter sp. SVR]GCF83685.1 two-component system response regulator [Geobacter sp. SVR]